MAGASLVAKRVARSYMTTACRATGAIARAESRMHGQLVVLCYHRVLPRERKAEYLFPDLVVTPTAFRRHCDVLQKRYTVQTLRDAYKTLTTGRPTEKPLAAITFDDGYRDNFTLAAPILREFDLPATFFLIAGLAGTQTRPWYDRLGRAIVSANRQEGYPDVSTTTPRTTTPPEPQASACAAPQTSIHTPHPEQLCGVLRDFGMLDTTTAHAERLDAKQIVERAKHLTCKQREQLVQAICQTGCETADPPDEDLIMTWVQLQALHEQGHEIGSHSRSHEILTQLDAEQLDTEVAESKQILEHGIGGGITSFCYPNGDHDDRVIEAVRSNGYACAVTVATGTNNRADATHSPFTLVRRFIHEERLTGVPKSATASLLRAELCGLSDTLFHQR